MRPPLPRELQGLRPYQHTVAVDPGQRSITLSENLASAAGAQGTGTATFDNGMVRRSVYGPPRPGAPCGTASITPRRDHADISQLSATMVTISTFDGTKLLGGGQNPS